MTHSSIVPLRLKAILGLLLVAAFPLDAQSSSNCRQILSRPAKGGGARPCTAAVSEAGTFAVFGPVVYTGGEQPGSPTTEVFSLNHSGAAYGLRIINLGSARATVTLNGVPIFKPEDFEGRGTIVSRPVNLAANNRLTVDISSGPGSSFSLEAFGVDPEPPLIAAVVSPKPNTAGWNNTNTTVTFTCSDSTDAVSCPSAVSVASEGANEVISGTAIDQAGKSAKASVTVNLDKTPPEIRATVVPAPNSAGWNNTPIALSYQCADSLSGIKDCPLPVNMGTSGDWTVANTARDWADNTATATTNVRIDRTAPNIVFTVTPTPNTAGWNNSDVNVTFGCNDSVSGIGVCPSALTVTSEGANQPISRTAADRAGNTTSVLVNISVDKTPPQIGISSPRDGDIVSAGMLTLSGTATDGLSGISTVTCQGLSATMVGTTFTCPVTVSQGPNPIVIHAIDRAGNSSVLNLTVQGGTPVILSTGPNTGQQGQTNLSVKFSGRYTHFSQGNTSADFGAGIDIVSLTVTSPTSALAVINIEDGAAIGARNITLATQTEVAALAAGFTVQAGTPVILSITPNAGEPGQQMKAVTITGQYTHFMQGATVADFGTGVALASLIVNSATSITATLNVDWATPTGSRDVNVKTGSESVSRTGGFSVKLPTTSPSPGDISVRKFAKCDGSSDDTTGLQAAIAAAISANRILRVDAPQACMARSLTIPGSLTLAGPGTLQQLPGPGTNAFLYITGDYVTISGLTINGQGSGPGGENLILAVRAAMLFIEDNIIAHTASGQYAVRLIAMTNARVTGNQLSDLAGPGIAVNDGSAYVMVSENHLDHTAATSGLSAFTAQTGSANGIHDVIFSNNIARESVHFCFEAGNFWSRSTDVTEVYNILFTGNTCEISNTSGTNDCSSASGPAACGGYSFATMSNSSITLNSYNAAGQVVSIAAIEMTGCASCNATGNTLTGDTSTVFRQGSEGITVDCSGCVISNNQITNWSPTNFVAGIEVHTVADPAFQSVNDNVVSGNTIVMPAGSITVKGIYVNCNNHGGSAPSASRTIISGNTVTGMGAGNGQAIALLQNDSACTLDHTVVSDNTLSGATSGIQIYGGTNYTLQNNQISTVTAPVTLNGGATLLSNRSGIARHMREAPPDGSPSVVHVKANGTAGVLAGALRSPQSLISVKDQGAKCDGLTDDTNALQKAISYAARMNKTVVLDGPAPCLSGPLVVSGPLQMLGPGTLKLINQREGGNLLTISGDRIEISGMTLDGNLAGREGSVLIAVRDAGKFIFQNNTVRNTNPGQYGFRAIGLSDAEVVGNQFDSIRGPGIAIEDGSHRVRLERNRVDHSAAEDGSQSGSALSAEVTGRLGSAISEIHFANNTILESVHYCIESGNREPGSNDSSLVSNITFESNRCTISNATGVNDCAAATSPAACGGYLMDNQQTSSMLDNTYEASGQFATRAAAQVTACRACVVYGNSLRGGSAGTMHSGSIGIAANCTACLIANNSVEGFEGILDGIEVRTSTRLLVNEDMLIAGNSVRLPRLDGRGIYIDCGDAGGSIERAVVTSNTVRGEGKGTAVTALGGPSTCVLDSAILGKNTISGTRFGYVLSDAVNIVYRRAEEIPGITAIQNNGGNSYLSEQP